MPVMATTAPPATGPASGVTFVTVGPAAYVNSSLVEVGDVPSGVVTVMSTVPADSAGDVAVIWLEESTV